MNDQEFAAETMKKIKIMQDCMARMISTNISRCSVHGEGLRII